VTVNTQARYVTPTLSVFELPGQYVDPTLAVDHMRRYGTVRGPFIVFSWTQAYRILRMLGLSVDEARHRINFARTGDMYATRPAARRAEQRPAGLRR
jgi:hypothetical protein